MRGSYHSWHGSSWLNDRINERRARFAQTAARYSRTSRIAFVTFFVLTYGWMHTWPNAVNTPFHVIGFWGSMIAGAVAVYTWYYARVQRSLVDVTLDF